MSLTLDQMGQILASAMTSFPTVGTAVTVLRSRLTSSSSVAVEPQVVSKAETKDYKTNYVAYVVIPSGVKSVYLALRKYAVSIVAFPQQKLTIKFDGGKINCDLAKGVSISTSDRQNYTGRDYFDGFEISRNAGEDHNFDHYVPFYFRYLTKGNSISKKSKMDVGSAHIYIRPSNVTIPELNIAEDLTSTYRAAGYIGGSQRVYECTVKACHTNSYLLQADTQLVEVSMKVLCSGTLEASEC